MEQAVFADGLPLRLTPDDVKRWHLASFPKLMEDRYAGTLSEALDAVYTMFSGGETLFNLQPPQLYYEKTRLLFRLLACWYIADQYPMLVAGTAVMGGVPLHSKRIGPVSITYAENGAQGGRDYLDLLSSLKSNPWGSKAYLMIRCAGKRLRIGGKKRSE